MVIRHIKILILALIFFATTPAQADHKNLKIGLTQYPSTLHPLYDSMVAKSYVLGTTLRPMTVYGTDWLPVCAICTELPSFDNGRAVRDENGKINVTYTLQDLTWGDGTKLTTKDIVFTYEVGKHPKSGISNATLFTKDIADIKVIDDKNFTIVLAKQQCEVGAIGDFYPLPAHLERSVFDKDPATYMNRTLYNTTPGTAGLYFGPYVVNQTSTGASITVTKNPHWKGKAPAFDSITFRVIENSSALSANLLSGDIDMIAGELGLLIDQALTFDKRLQRQKPGQYNVIYKPGLTYEHIDLPLDKPPFNDVRLRRALLHAIDRDTLNTALFGSKQPVALTNINPLDSVFTDDVKTYAFDPDAAGKLLDNVGWKKSDDGFRYNADGKKLTITLSTTAGNKTREIVAQAIQSNWKKIGIDTKIDMVQARVLFGEVMRKRTFLGGVMYAWMSAPKNIPRSTLHSETIPSEENNYAGQNYPGYNNPDADKIIDDLEIVCAEDKNTALWHDLQKRYAEELPALPLYYRANAFFLPTWLDGITPTGHMHPTTLHVEDWSVVK